MSDKSVITDKAKALLAKQDYSHMQLQDKLNSLGYDPLEVASVVTYCEQQGWIDDRRLIERYAHQRVDKGYGPFHIAQALIAKKISESLVAQVLAGFDHESWAKAAHVALKKLAQGENLADFSVKRKVIRQLVARGFNDDQIASVLGGSIEFDSV